MIHSLKAYCSPVFDPYYNLATEQYLLESVEPGCCALYLWQNQNTVVIGRNQNPWLECRTSLLEQDGGHLARRLSGGGAVFHDLGNLNFTFLVSEEDYSVDRQLKVIQSACGALGLETERSGRNDILCQGRKFSGNAFYTHNGRSYHHGTLLVNVDTEKLGRYLTPSKAKLESKGVSSVRSRIINLLELSPSLTISSLRAALLDAFGSVYGLPVQLWENLDEEAILKLQAHYSSWDWLYGRNIPCTLSCEGRFNWGSVRLELQIDAGFVKNCRVYSDSMDWNVAPAIETALIGCPFRLDALQHKLLDSCPQYGAEVFQLLKEQNI